MFETLYALRIFTTCLFKKCNVKLNGNVHQIKFSTNFVHLQSHIYINICINVVYACATYKRCMLRARFQTECSCGSICFKTTHTHTSCFHFCHVLFVYVYNMYNLVVCIVHILYVYTLNHICTI